MDLKLIADVATIVGSLSIFLTLIFIVIELKKKKIYSCISLVFTAETKYSCRCSNRIWMKVFNLLHVVILFQSWLSSGVSGVSRKRKFVQE